MGRGRAARPDVLTATLAGLALEPPARVLSDGWYHDDARWERSCHQDPGPLERPTESAPSTIDAVRRDGSASAVDRADAAALGDRLAGRVVLPGDDVYETARRVWNGMVDRRPAVIAECATSADVAAALAFARERDLPVSVRGGGHNAAGVAVVDRGLVVDLSPMKGVEVDTSVSPAIAHVGGG